MPKDTEPESKKNYLPHDKLFKDTFKDINFATQLLTEYLPPKILKLLDLTTLRVEDGEYIAPKLKNKFSDLLYSMKMKNEKDGDLFILVEHQSSVDHDMTKRLWQYMSLICERYKYKDGKYPLVLPIILYNGQRKYNASCKFFENFRKPELARDFLFNSYLLIDLKKITDDEINYNIDISITLHSMKHAYAKDRLFKLQDLIENKGKDLIIRDKKNDYKQLTNVVYYLEDNISEREKELLNDIIINLLPDNDGEEIMVTIADSYRKEGRKEGKEEGLIKVAKMLLKEGDSINKVIKVTGLPKTKILNIQDSLNKSTRKKAS